MKKLTALFLSLALLLVLCACGAPNASSGNASSGDAYASWGDASSGDAYASWGNASSGDAYASSGNATGTLALTEAPAAADTPYFCVQMEQSRLYAIPYGGGKAKLLADKYTNCFDQNGDSVLASFDDGSAARINVLTGESEEVLPAGTQQFHRIHAFSGGFVGEYYSIRESKLYLCEDGKEPVEIFPGEYFGDVCVSGDVLIGSDYSGDTCRITGYVLPSLEKLWTDILDPYCYPSYNSSDNYFISDSSRGVQMRVDPVNGAISILSGYFAVNDNILHACNDTYLVEGNYQTNFALNLVCGSERLTLDIPSEESSSKYVAATRGGKALIACSQSSDAGDYGWTSSTRYYVLDLESTQLYEIGVKGYYSELFAAGDFPVIDSSTARKPLTSSIYRFFCLDTGYGGAEPLCSTTHGAWLNIADKKADIALLAAPTDEEKAYLAERGVEVEMKLYGGDGLVFIGNSACGVTDLTLDQVRAIFRGEITNWSEVGGPDGAIAVFGREAGSGTRGAFEEILGIEDACAYTNEYSSTGDVIGNVASNPNAIGYASLSAVNDTVTAVAVNGVVPSEETVADGSFAIQRPFVVVTVEGQELSPAAQAFLDYAMSDEVADIITAAGAVPASLAA